MIKILTAYSVNGGLITLTKMHERRMLEEWRKTDKFLCTQCKGNMILKVGQVVIPHFAHMSVSECSKAFSEGESPDHLAGKQQLYDWFQKQSFDVQMEAPITQIQQRPDLLVEDRYAIEFQCSPLQVQRFEERNYGYAKAGILPIWILRTPPALCTLSDGVHLITLSNFHQFFIPHRPVYGQTLLTYDVTREQFLYLSHLLPVTKTQFIAKVRRLPLLLQQFPFLSVNLPDHDEFSVYFAEYRKKRHQFLSSRIRLSRKGINDRFLRICYEHRIRPEELPLWFGLPVRGAEYFEDHPVEWQTALLSLIASTGSVEGAMNRFRKEREIPPIARRAANSYLNLLNEAGIDVFKEDCWHQPYRGENLFHAVFNHFLAKRYEN